VLFISLLKENGFKTLFHLLSSWLGVKPRLMVPNVARVSICRCCCSHGRCPLVLLLLLSAPLTPLLAHPMERVVCEPSWDRSSFTSEFPMCGCVPSPHTAYPEMPSNLDRAQGASPTVPKANMKCGTPYALSNGSSQISIQRAVGYVYKFK
jgi:hypothetical protein